MHRHIRGTAAAIAAAVLTLTGCSNDGGGASDQAGGSSTPPTPSAAEPTSSDSASATAPSEPIPSDDPTTSTSPSTPEQTTSTPEQTTSSPEQTTSSPEQTTGTPREPGNQQQVLDSLPGSTGNGCIDVGDDMTVRAGSIAAGDFVQARQTVATAPAGQEATEITLYVIPQHSKPMTKATVKATSGDTTRTVTSQSVESAADWKYYRVFLPVTPGSWTFAITAGQDRGCFTVELDAG